MNPSFASKLSQSTSDFQNIVWPQIASNPSIGGGDLRPVEAVAPSSFKDELDVLAGIDAWQIIRDRSAMRGIGSRVQWGENYESFTIRYSCTSGRETEYAKRLFAIQSKSEGYLYPHLTIQAYLDQAGGTLLSAAAIPTELLIGKISELFQWGRINDSGDRRYGIRSLPDGTEFLYVSWNYLLHTDMKDQLVIHRPKP